MNTQTITDFLTINAPAQPVASAPATKPARKILGWLDLVKPTPDVFAKLVGLALIIYLLGVPQSRPFLALPFIGVFIYGTVIDQRLLTNGFFWLATTGLCLLNVIFNFYSAANHHFVLIYFNLVLALTFFHPANQRAHFLRENVRWILVVMFFFVTFQKVLSPTYMDGSFFAFLTAKGGFFSIFQGLMPGLEELVSANSELIRNFEALNPREQTMVALVVEQPLILQIFSIGTALAVVIVEFLTMLGFLLFSKGKIRHAFLLMTAIGVAFSRGEGGYLSLLCAAGFILCTDDAKIFRPLYLLCFIVFSGLIFIGWMFH